MINIAFLCNSSSWGGLEMNILQMAKWLISEGHQVILFCPCDSVIAQKSRQANIPVYCFHQRIKYIDLGVAYEILKKIKLHHINILALSQSKEIATGVLVKKVIGQNYGLRIVYFQQMMIGIKKKDWLHNFMYKHLDAWIVPLPSVLENTLQYTQLSSQKIEIIPLCIEMEKFSTRQASTQSAREFFELPSQGFFVGIVGRIDQQKGQEFLIKALYMLKKQGIEFYIVFFGEETRGEEGTYLPTLQRLVSELGLAHLVFFRQFADNAHLAYSCLDVFVMASWQETFGMVTIEAMAMGLPIIGSYSGGTKDLIQEYKNGLFFEPKSPESLALQLLKLFNSHKLRYSLSSNALENVKNRFSHYIFLEKIDYLMNKLLTAPLSTNTSNIP
jgi:glycosyltransferase involved in cell wall biosynthesis